MSLNFLNKTTSVKSVVLIRFLWILWVFAWVPVAVGQDIAPALEVTRGGDSTKLATNQKTFDPPAHQDIADFEGLSPKLREKFRYYWNLNAFGWTEQALLGNPWSVLNGSPNNYYYNPLTTEIPPDAKATKVKWSAIPNRVDFYFGNQFSQQQKWEFADNGILSDGTPTPAIPSAVQICEEDSTPTTPYGPYGPRGWQDEYLEWSVKRRPSDNEIIRVDFTCENPEYWNTLWKVDPTLVLNLYRKTLDNPDIFLEDLILFRNGQPVIDPSTQKVTYNPLNKWNSGTKTTPTSGGAIHLTSTPNTVQTQVGLAGLTTKLRTIGNSDAEKLLCCSDFGQPQRHSDPHIGQSGNRAVEAGNKLSLANPIGLYIQMPSFAGFALSQELLNAIPDAQPMDCFKITRGQKNLPGFEVDENFILHIVFEAPQEWQDQGFSIGDVLIEGNPIEWGAQIVEKLEVALYPVPIKADILPVPEPCLEFLDANSSPRAFAQPAQLMHNNVFEAFYGVNIPNPVNFPMSLVSNSTLTLPSVRQGDLGVLMALTCDFVTLGPNGEFPSVTFTIPETEEPDPTIEVTVVELSAVYYAIPGNSYPGNSQMLKILLSIDEGAPKGPRNISITNHDQDPADPAPYFLLVEEGRRLLRDK